MVGETVWRRYQNGMPLFTLGLTEEERTAIAADLRSRVQRQGIAALRCVPEVTRNFVLHASQYLARVATRLEWAPVLDDIGVLKHELGKYPELYDSVWHALTRVGRTPIVSKGERRFLATFLREGGLPAFIGDISELVVDRATEIGWDALEDEGARAWVVGRVQQSANGSARRLLDTAEGRLALGDFLRDAARARAALVDRGQDLRTLSTPQSVRQALDVSGIALPLVANETLLLAVLGSFTSERTPVVSMASPLRLMSATTQRVELRLRVELEALDLAAALPERVSHLAVAADTCRPPSHRVERVGERFVNAASRKSQIDLPRVGSRGDTVVDARFTGTGGAVTVVPLGVLPWPAGDILWFDATGELLFEQREVIRSGESFTIVTWAAAQLRAEGHIDLEELRAPLDASHAYLVRAHGAGALLVEQGDGPPQRVESREHGLDVTILHRNLAEPVAPAWMVRALPDLVVADGVEVDLYVRTFRGEERLVRRGVRGRLTLSADSTLRQVAGTVRVRLLAKDGRFWSATWHVWPRGLEISSRAGRVTVGLSSTLVVHAEPGRVERGEGEFVVFPPPDAQRITLFLTLPSGERLPVKVDIATASVRLRPDSSSEASLPLDGTVQLTERQVYAGACLELAADPGAKLTVANRMGEVILQLVQPSERRVLLPLTELAAYIWRVGESPMPFVARVDESADNYAFKVHLPRLGRPDARLTEGAIDFEFALDDLDVPEKPALALFPVCPPTATAAIARCTLTKKPNGKYSARLEPQHAPTVRGRYIAFLVDRRTEEPRPMSGGRLMSIPVDLGEPPCPPEIKGLDQALWTGNQGAIADEINAMVGNQDLRAFVGAFAGAVRERARYGLGFFRLFDTVARRCPWLLLASWFHLPEEDRDDWLSLWPRQIRDFSWLYLKRSDASLLARALPRRTSEERMSIVSAADRAWRLPKVVEYVLCSALFVGDSLLPVNSIRAAETNSLRAAPGKWESHRLPQSVAGRRWLLGVELDADQEAQVEDVLQNQLLFGKRAQAIRDLFLGRAVPQYASQLPAPASPVANRTLQGIEGDWKAIDAHLTDQIHGLEREIAIAALWLVEHRQGRRYLDENQFRHVLTLEKCSVDLFDYWLVAADLMRNDKT